LPTELGDVTPIVWQNPPQVRSPISDANFHAILGCSCRPAAGSCELDLRRPILRRTLLHLLAFALVASSAAAASSDFYDNISQRWIQPFDSGLYDSATKELRIAAFGFVDSVDQFETTQVYIAVASHRLKKPNDARAALLKLLSAERIARRYQAL